ncbi:hypothetical protein OC834_004808 [Tilletia horrida]|uniref:Uncharacterized protein n=1 Tax=Tilletia horrida TaxID=155126 RepID=A0AAN6JKP3_9BASI|nr:hypothetical protein OC834_004808 [Tilletia horrida]KAK0531739.1 hypothetical protein OC842_003523 [Tilletia horrida]KAK0559392.1 hypothetical protein OC844_004439 [Tilletia horrida]
MVGSFEFLRSLPDVPASASASPGALADYLAPFISHTGPKAFSILAWIYVGVHFVFLAGVSLVVGVLLKNKKFWLFRTVNGRHGIVLVHNVVDVPLCLIIFFLLYDSVFWIISLLGYQSDVAQHNWQVLHWLRYIILAATGFYFMTGVAAVWPFSPSTMRYPWMWNLVMIGFLPCAVLATIPPMLQANAEWNKAWEIYKALRSQLREAAPGAEVPSDLVYESQLFLFHTSKYAYKHAIVAIILVIFCAGAALVFSVIGFRVARIVWQDVQTRRMRTRREMRMARRWSRPSLNFTDSATTSKGFASVESGEWSTQIDPDSPRLPADRGDDATMSEKKIESSPRCDSSMPLRMSTGGGITRPGARPPLSDNSQRELRMHFYRTLILFIAMWSMIASLVCSGLFFTIQIYPATRDATPDPLFGNSALRVLCIFHIVEFANITFFGSIWIGTLVVHRVVALKRSTDSSEKTLFKERPIRPVGEGPARPAHGYTFAIGQQTVQVTDSVAQHRSPTSPTTPTFEVTAMTPFTVSPPLTPMLNKSSSLRR